MKIHKSNFIIYLSFSLEADSNIVCIIIYEIRYIKYNSSTICASSATLLNNGARLAIYCQILVEARWNMRIFNCGSVTIPDAAGCDDLLGQCADIWMNWQSGEKPTRRPQH